MQKTHHFLLTLLVSLLFSALPACSSSKIEKPLPEAITSPEKLLNQGIHQYNNNNYQKATFNFEKALRQYRSIDNPEGIAKSCMNLAKSLMAVNSNALAADYLQRAESIIQQAQLTALQEHLALLKSTLAIKNRALEQAEALLAPLLDSNNINIRLAAIKNRSLLAFAARADDRQSWLEKYIKLQKTLPETKAHRARIYRFQAELEKDETKALALLTQALEISRQLADRPAIAATLTQSSAIDIRAENYRRAEDKLLRALFIRHQLGDIHHTTSILQMLHQVYTTTGNTRQQTTAMWIERISGNDLKNWDSLYRDFETYPLIQ